MYIYIFYTSILLMPLMSIFCYYVTIRLCLTYYGTSAISAPAQSAACLRIMLTNAETEESTCPLLLLHETITMSQGFTVCTRPSLRTPSSNEDLSQSSRRRLVMEIFPSLGFYLIVKVDSAWYFLFIWEGWRLVVDDAIASWPIVRR